MAYAAPPAPRSVLIVDELGYVPLSQTGSELLFEIFSHRYGRGATIVTSNLPSREWTSVFASERLTGALLDRPELGQRTQRSKIDLGANPGGVRMTMTQHVADFAE